MWTNIAEEQYQGKSFLFKEQFITSSKGWFTLENRYDAIRLHHITGRKTRFKNEIFDTDTIFINPILSFNKYHVYKPKSKVGLMDSTTQPMLSVGWHMKKGLEKVYPDLLYFSHSDNKIDLSSLEVLVTPYNFSRPESFKGVYVIFDTEGLHRGTPQLLEMCSRFDFVFMTTLQDVEFLQYLGYKNVFWMPPGCSPDYHSPLGEKIDKFYDATLIGNFDPNLRRFNLNRKEFVDLVQGNEYKIFFGRAGVGQDYVRKMHQAPLVLDRSTGYNIGTRAFESLSSGVFVLTNELAEGNPRNGMDLLFVKGIHYDTYVDEPMLCRKQLSFWKEELNERKDNFKLTEEIIRFTQTYHSWKMRLMNILKVVEES